MVRILVVDDSPVEIKIIRKLLGNQYAIIEALSGKAGIRLAFQERPDLILLDILMPGLDGITVCKELKSDPKTSDIPIIFITAVSEANSVVRGFEAGGQDYITKPFYAPELCARIKVHLDLKKSREMVMSYAETLAEKNKQLHELMDKLEASAMTDFITGLDNRRSMTQKIKAQLEAQTDNEQAVLIMLDIDDFKHINDSYGHECGDTILQDIAGIMSAAMGQRGVLARWGGEEFLIMLFCAQVTEAQAIAEEIRQSIEICPFCYKQAIISVTATLGIARLDKDQGLDESIRRADDALYQGKKQAKNCVVVMK